MVSNRDNLTDSETSGDLRPSQTQTNRGSAINTEPMFRLIDSILPFEACLYYQILPIALEGTYLRLAMVNLQDTTALDYARRILAYLNCSLNTEEIASEVHQAMLSAYLNHTGRASSPQKPEPRKHLSQNEQPTFIVDSPEHLGSPQVENIEIKAQEQKIGAAEDRLARKSAPLPSNQEIPASESRPNSNTAAPQVNHLPVLPVQARYLSSPIQELVTLPPNQLLSELLGRVLVGGIGRLYFERQPENGRILWSQDGVLQSVLEALPLPVFQGAINELKRMAHLSLITVQQPKQVEIERRYLQERLLLCLRVIPSERGEEATLQVLRGAALKFYQQQQVAKLSRDALTLAQQLERKLSEIRDRTHLHAAPIDALPALNQMLENLEQQMAAIRKLQTTKPLDNSTNLEGRSFRPTNFGKPEKV